MFAGSVSLTSCGLRSGTGTLARALVDTSSDGDGGSRSLFFAMFGSAHLQDVLQRWLQRKKLGLAWATEVVCWA